MRFLIFAATLFLFQSVFGQSLLNPLNSTEGGAAYEVCLSNGYLYVGSANSLQVYSLNGPNQTPGQLEFSKRLLSNIDQIKVHNSFLYVCANHDGLYKFDIANPILPVEIYHYIPQHIDESIYDIAFYGDTIIAAAKTKLNLLTESGNTLTYRSTLAVIPDPGRIRGIDIKDSLLAYPVGFTKQSQQDGIYLYNLKSMTLLDYFQDTDGDPLEVYFGQNTSLIHVMGGALPATLFNGRYYALNYHNPSNLRLIYQDTVTGFPILSSIASPMSAKLINDTIYIANHGGGPIVFQPQFTGQIYVYDASDTGNIHLLTDIYAGLYHFDLDINETTRKMYVASEWYGILSLDVSDIYNEINLGKTLTGGWCHGSAYANNRLVEANEGYGIRLFDLSDKEKPVLVAEDTTTGFCRAVSISNNGDYAYGWFLTGKGLRIFDGDNLNLIADTSVLPLAKTDFKKSRHHNGKLAVILEVLFGSDRLVIADVSNPALPEITHYRIKAQLEDLSFHSTGKLIVCARDSLIVFDPQTMGIVASAVPPLGILQPFKAITIKMDTVYVYYGGVVEGIARYYFDDALNSLNFLDASPYDLHADNAGRAFLASNDSILFIASTIDSLKAVSINPPHQLLEIYNHGADFIFDNIWGVHDLYFKDGFLFLNEYMGQTTVFGEEAPIGIIDMISKGLGIIYPNPASKFMQVDPGTNSGFSIIIYNSQGREIYSKESALNSELIDISTLRTGIYIIICSKDGKIIYSGKAVISN